MRALLLIALFVVPVLAQAQRYRVVQVGERLPNGQIADVRPDCSDAALSGGEDGVTFVGTRIALFDVRGEMFCLRHEGVFYQESEEIFSGSWVDENETDYQYPGINVEGTYSWPSGQWCEGRFNLAENLPAGMVTGFQSGTCTFSDGRVFEGTYSVEGQERYADGLLSQPSGAGQRGRFRLASTDDGYRFEAIDVVPAQRTLPSGAPQNPVVIRQLAFINWQLIRYGGALDARLSINEAEKSMFMRTNDAFSAGADLAQVQARQGMRNQLVFECIRSSLFCVSRHRRSFSLYLSDRVAPGPDLGAIINAFEEIRTAVTGFPPGLRYVPLPPPPVEMRQGFGFSYGPHPDYAPVTIIRALAPGGPADRAGLRPGMILEAVNGEALFERPMSEIRQMLSQAGAASEAVLRVTQVGSGTADLTVRPGPFDAAALQRSDEAAVQQAQIDAQNARAAVEADASAPSPALVAAFNAFNDAVKDRREGAGFALVDRHLTQRISGTCRTRFDPNLVPIASPFERNAIDLHSPANEFQCSNQPRRLGTSIRIRFRNGRQRDEALRLAQELFVLLRSW